MAILLTLHHSFMLRMVYLMKLTLYPVILFGSLIVLCCSAAGQSPVAPPPTQTFQTLISTQSNVEYYTTNYGIFGLDIRNSRAGLFWPAGSARRYLFGGGCWFGAMKYNPDSARRIPLSLMSYNPNSGASWLVPGRATTPGIDEPRDGTPQGIILNRLYNSLDYNQTTGEDLGAPDTHPLWPLWIEPDGPVPSVLQSGLFVPENEQRKSRLADGWSPGFLGTQQFYSVWRDNDLSRYEIGETAAARLGYPLGLEFQNSITGWQEGPLADVLVLTYTIVNRSEDTLYDCYFAPVFDPDIGENGNDRVSTVIPDRDQDSLGLAQVWSEANGGDQGYGYFGVDFLGTPSVDAGGYLRKGRLFFDPEEQLGLSAVRNWIIDVDPRTVEARYDFISSGVRDGDNGAGEKRLLVSSGPFHMVPGDTARFVVALLFADAGSSTPDGTDNENLVALDSYVQELFNVEIRESVSVPDEWNLHELIRRLDLR